MNYYYARENSPPIGPYTAEQMRQLHQQGTLDGNSWVIVEGEADWKTYASLFPPAADDGQSGDQKKLCAGCGAGNDADALFCEACGQKIEVSAERTRVFSKHAFISHSSSDRESAECVCEILEGNGVSCWMAPRDVAPGAPYDEEIMRGIKSTQAFVLLLSDESNKSEHVKRELSFAIESGNAVYPIRIQDVEPGEKLQYFLQGKQWVDAWKPPIEAHLERLARLIAGSNVDANGIQHPRKSRRFGGAVWRRRWRKRLVWAAVVTATLGALAGGWYAFVYDRTPSPEKTEAVSRAEYANRIRMAKTAEENKQWEVARNCYTEAIESAKAIRLFDFSEARLGLAQAEGELSKAKHADQKQSQSETLLAKARLAEANRQWKESVIAYEEALRLADNPQTRSGLARAKEALTRECESLVDKAKTAASNKRWKEAVSTYEEALKLDAKPEVQAALDRTRASMIRERDDFLAAAKLAESRDQWQEAVAACEAALAVISDPETQAALDQARDGLTQHMDSAQKLAQFDRLMAEAAKAQTNDDPTVVLAIYDRAAAAAPSDEQRALAQAEARKVRERMKAAFDTFDQRARDAEGNGNLPAAVDLLEKALANAPDEAATTRVRDLIVKLKYEIAHPPTPVNQTFTLMCVNNSTVAKRHPSAEQILDGAGNVIGEVSLDLTDCRDGCGTATLSFKKDKESPVICVFRKDDSVGQTRVGRSDGISFSGRVIELKKISGTYWSNGKFDVLTIEVTATSRGQKPKYGRRAMLSVPSTTTNAPADPEPMPEATAVGASEPPEPLKYFEVLLRNAPVDPPTLARVSRAAMEQSNLVSRVRLLTAYCLGQIGVGQDEMARRALDSLRKTAESDVDMAAPYLALTDLVTVRVICTACNGDKRMEKECATCAGNGQCRVCGGSAERAVNELGGKFNVACFTCNKTGKCKGCGGVGKVRTVCNTCQGRGDMIDRTRCLDIYRTFCLDGLRAR